LHFVSLSIAFAIRVEDSAARHGYKRVILLDVSLQQYFKTVSGSFRWCIKHGKAIPFRISLL